MPDRPDPMETADSIRIDKWLWYARFCKTRTLATELVGKRRVRVNQNRIEKPSHTVRIGDVITVPRGREVMVVRVIAVGVRRGPASEAQGLYEELTPAE